MAHVYDVLHEMMMCRLFSTISHRQESDIKWDHRKLSINSALYINNALDVSKPYTEPLELFSWWISTKRQKWMSHAPFTLAKMVIMQMTKIDLWYHAHAIVPVVDLGVPMTNKMAVWL